MHGSEWFIVTFLTLSVDTLACVQHCCPCLLQGRTSFDGNNSTSDASERSERCAAPSSLDAGRSESAPNSPPAPYPDGTSPERRAHSAAPALHQDSPPARRDSVSSDSSGSSSRAAHGGSQSTNLGSSLSRRDATLMDADCCGDSGCGMPLARSVPAPTRAPSLPCDRFFAATKAGSAPLQRAASSGDALATLLQKEVCSGPHWAGANICTVQCNMVPDVAHESCVSSKYSLLLAPSAVVYAAACVPYMSSVA